MSINLTSIGFKSPYNSNIKASGTSKKGKKDISDAVNEKSIEKVKQLATQDAIRGKRGKEASIYINECREKVAPDRKKIFSEIQAKASTSIKKYKKPERPHDVWEYLLDIADKTDEYSFKGHHSTANGHTFIRAFDENGENIGVYDSNNGWTVRYTSLEKQTMETLSRIYNETYKSVGRKLHSKNNNYAASIQSESRLDVTA